MALIGKAVTVELPHEPNNHATIRPLSGAQLDQAAYSMQLSDAELKKAAKAEPAPEPKPTRIETYNLDAVLLHGLQALTGPLYLDDSGEPSSHVPVTKQLITQQLDQPTRLITFNLILDITPGAIADPA